LLTAFAIVMLTLAASSACLLLLRLSASRPPDLGIRDGRLAPCPASPNCVSTQAEDRDHWIAPLTCHGDPAAVIDALCEIIEQLPRTQVIEKTENYLYVEFRSAVFRFVDDVEFYVEEDSSRVHLRSASRVGHSDLGVNRERMELIRQKFQTTQSKPQVELHLMEPQLESHAVH
jgi:uncharacterized protein (DUF1499 family)